MTNTDALTGKLLDVISQVQGAVSAHSAEAVNLVLTSTRIDGIHWLVSVLVGFVIASIIACVCAIYVAENEKNKKKDDDALMLGAAVGLCVGMLLIAVVSFIGLIDPWNWIQVFDPKLYLAHEIMGKVLQ